MNFRRFALIVTAFASIPLPASAAESTDADEGVRVLLHADDPRATLERRVQVESVAGLPLKEAGLSGVATWEPACRAPCDAALDPKFTYRVAGEGLVPSEAFVLPSDRDVLAVDATMGSSTGRLGGLALTGIGAGGVVLGGAALAISPVLAHDGIGSSTLRTGVLASGAAVTTLSALVLGAGIWLWSKNDTRIHPDGAGGFAF